MAEIDEAYICFKTKKTYFVLPIFDLLHVLPHNDYQEGEGQVFDPSLHKKVGLVDFSAHRGGGRRSVLVVGDEAPFGIVAEEVIGLVSILPQNQYDLPTLVLDEDNAYLAGVSYLPDLEGLAFLLDLDGLRPYIKNT